jgi:predicted ATP-grasp superfamily ATP-dependent carboligase
MEFLFSEIKRNHYDCLFPMEEETLLLVARHQREISLHTSLVIPELPKIEFVRDKGNLIRFAETHGIPVPKTYFCPPALTLPRQGGGESRKEGKGWVEEAPIPAVIKPRISSGSFGIAYVRRREDLLPAYEGVNRHYPFPLVQEWIPDGMGTYGFSALFDQDSNVKAAFIHKKLRMYPVQGGPSTLREGVVHPQIMELGIALLKALRWTGIAMIEFKVDPRDGIPKLMEINPRFWGSLQLAIVSGVDFPWLMVKLARGETFPPVLDYQVNRRCRWLLFGDILHFFKNPRRFHLDPPFFRFSDPETSDDILSLEDPLPVLGAAAAFFTFLYDPEMKRFLERR